MTVLADRDVAEFTIEDLSTGMHASGFGQVGDGRTFSYWMDRMELSVEIYRARCAIPVPQAEDVVATARHRMRGVDLTDERSMAAAVRDAVAAACMQVR